VSESDASSNYDRLSGPEAVLASFLECSVVQLITGDPSTGRATVVAVHPADVILTTDRLVAVDGELEWSWMLSEIEAVRHGATETWTIVEVPGVTDHGVAVRDGDAIGFREQLDRALGPHRGGNGGGASDGAGGAPRVEVEGDRSPGPSAPVRPVVLEPSPSSAREAPAFAPGTDAAEPDVAASERALVNPSSIAHHAAAPDPAFVHLPLPPLSESTVLEQEPASAIITLADVDPDVTQLHHLPPPPPSASAPIAAEEPSSRGRTGLLSRVRRRHTTMGGPSEAPLSLAGLEAREISAWFGTHHVLDRVSLMMEPGEVTALIGPSGCGKSTFLRILNRMHEMIGSASLAGEVLLDGEDIYDPQKKLTDARRQIGMVFQKPNPFPAMSIYDNVVASYRLTGTKISSSEKDEVVETCLAKAGLWNEVRDRLRAPGGGLSGGQQQRLCIARALAIRPRVLLMDEPCSALDPTSTRRIEQTIMELGSEVTIVIVTHNMQQAARVSDQCAFFLAEQGTPGVIVEHGPTGAMFESPQDPRTFDYVNGRFG
jgi:phosphate transport system ATP-binding protein